MSTFGRPPGQINFRPTPPERGSFPLDHDGECTTQMKSYLSCLKSHRGVNGHECRELARGYLGCRMERNLMRKDEWKNLGFSEQQEDVVRRIEEGKREEGMKGLGGDERDGKDGGR